MAKLSPVCPPNPANTPWGFSFLIISVTASSVIGSIYTLSTMPSSVIIVAGLLLIKTVSIPSSIMALQAWVPA